jgi:hypothetical protein
MSKIVQIAFTILVFSGFGCGAFSQNDTTVRVLEAHNYLNSNKPDIIGIDQYLSLKIQNLGRLYSNLDKKTDSPILFFNNTPMSGIKLRIVDTTSGLLVYHLTRDSLSKPSWDYFYHWPRASYKFISVSVGLENGSPVPTDVIKMKLVIYHLGLAIFAGISLAALLILFIIYSSRTSILKDTNTTNSDSQRPYSMSKSQLAWWTFIVGFSFVFIWISTHSIPIITGSTWILLAISIGTTAGAKIIDVGQNDNQSLIKSSGNWLSDVLDDGKGPSIHRFQMLIWTLILGAYFIQQVVVTLAIPQLSNELLVLMGISNGTYLGLRIPEKLGNSTTADKPDTPQVNSDIPPVG